MSWLRSSDPVLLGVLREWPRGEVQYLHAWIDLFTVNVDCGQDSFIKLVHLVLLGYEGALVNQGWVVSDSRSVTGKAASSLEIASVLRRYPNPRTYPLSGMKRRISTQENNSVDSR